MTIRNFVAAGLSLMVVLGVTSQPADAQNWRNWRNNFGFGGQQRQHRAAIAHNVSSAIQQSSTMLATGINSGHITVEEEAQLRQGLNNIVADANARGWRGYNDAEYANVMNSLAQLNAMITAAGTNGINRYY